MENMDSPKINSSNLMTTENSLEIVSTGNSVDEGDHTLAYVAVPFGALAVVVVIAFIVSMLHVYHLVRSIIQLINYLCLQILVCHLSSFTYFHFKFRNLKLRFYLIVVQFGCFISYVFCLSFAYVHEMPYLMKAITIYQRSSGFCFCNPCSWQ